VNLKNTEVALETLLSPVGDVDCLIKLVKWRH